MPVLFRGRVNFYLKMQRGQDTIKQYIGTERKSGNVADEGYTYRNRKVRQILIIGGGASGLLAAIMAAREGAEVTLLEHKDRLGKKILSTGNGRCNLGNRRMEKDCYHSGEEEFPWRVLEWFGLQENLNFWKELGLVLKEKNGYLYPWSESAASVADLLARTVRELSVEIILECHVSSCEPCKQEVLYEETLQNRRVFRVRTDQGDFFAERVILAAGSKAASVLGSDGSGYEIAKNMGLSIQTVLPALVQLRCIGTFFKVWSGVRVEAQVHLFVDGKEVAHDTGEVQCTEYGISGIPVFQVSRFAAIGLFEEKKVEVFLDFLPFLNEREKTGWLKERCERFGMRKAEELLDGVIHKKLAWVLLGCAGIAREQTVCDISFSQREKLNRLLLAFRLEVSGTNSFEQAQICCGGICTNEVCSTTMEAKQISGLYLCGEILDVDGICGGYNLQWAFSSGMLAGQTAAKALKREYQKEERHWDESFWVREKEDKKSLKKRSEIPEKERCKTYDSDSAVKTSNYTHRKDAVRKGSENAAHSSHKHRGASHHQTVHRCKKKR